MSSFELNQYYSDVRARITSNVKFPVKLTKSKALEVEQEQSKIEEKIDNLFEAPKEVDKSLQKNIDFQPP